MGGCASTKKRTTSVDDLTKGGGGGAPGDPSKKNGQLANESANSIQKQSAGKLGSEAPGGGDATRAIQIPGAHNSFLAPDGIPFIDEDVDDDLENDVGSTRVVVAKADVNKNVVVVKPPTVAVSPPVVVVAGAGPPSKQRPAQELEAEEERKRVAAAEQLRRQLDGETDKQNKSSTPEISGEVRVEQMAVTTVESSPPPLTDEEQEKAAVKIQAGIRGYRDRQKVKALKAAKEHPSNGPDTSYTDDKQDHGDVQTHKEVTTVKIQESSDDGASGGTTTVVTTTSTTTTTIVSNDVEGQAPPSPEMERAATKIQASYKGYKTRKQLGKIHD